MMAHVAEASEQSGRVLLWVEPGQSEIDIAAECASRFAHAFNAEIETISFNADSLLRARMLPEKALAHVGSPDGVTAGVERSHVVQSLIGTRQMRTIERAARRQGVPLLHTDVEGEALDRLAELCLSRGPWNVVVLTKTACEETATHISDIFANVSGATGIVAVPVRASYATGPIAVVVEDAERLPAMLRAASRLKGLCSRVHLIIAADRRSDLNDLEAHVRLVTASHQGLVIEPPEPALGVAGALDETLRALKTSFVIACFGGTLLPSPRALARTMSVAAAPFLLVR
ncbi:MAG: hypothetical protein ABL907_22315 [Hyphomicrobium sp.]